MAGAVDRLTRTVKRLARLAAEQQALSVDLLGELVIIRKTIAADVTGRLEAAVEVSLLRAADARRRAELRAAGVGAWRMEMRFNRRGAALVRIDEGEPFQVSRCDAKVLRALTPQSLVDADGFPPWVTYEQLAEELGRKTGIVPTRHALIESVYRIRRALKRVHHNPYLLKVDRKSGRLRFLLRAGPRVADGQALR